MTYFSKIIQDSAFMANENGAEGASATVVRVSLFKSRELKPKYNLTILTSFKYNNKLIQFQRFSL